MDSQRPHHLRVLVADGATGRHDAIVSIVTGLRHEVIASDLDVAGVAAATAELMPDVALVCVGDSSARALALISGIVQEAACPVIAMLDASDPQFVNEAAQRGIFAYITDSDPQELQSALDIVLRRFAEFHSLEGAFGRRAVIERAKGILMERHAIDEQRAFELLRDHSRRGGRKLIDVAHATADMHTLLPAAPRPSRPAGQHGGSV
jgi:AmiR/NasT family two-component response regulator